MAESINLALIRDNCNRTLAEVEIISTWCRNREATISSEEGAVRRDLLIRVLLVLGMAAILLLTARST